MSFDLDDASSRAHRVKAAAGRAGGANYLEWPARAGFVARALVYGIVGVLALQLALGVGGKAASQQGAFQTLAQQPLGKALLVLVAIGLAGYALWRLFRGLLGHGVETGEDSATERIGALGSGVTYGLLCIAAVKILLGSGTQGGSQQTQKAAGGVLGWPGGQWLVGLAGLILVGIAAYQAYRGLSKNFLDESKTEEMSASVRRWVARIGIVGHLARAVVFGLTGIFLIKAALEYDPNAAVGLDGALRKLAEQSYGSVLLGIVAAGLIAFGLYSLVDARYHRI
jgi:hypothetical protein